ncbi:DUF6053 domain-containing protein [Lysobacter enzymogenes]|uniref:DUF6053 domain-containing protein n=1 Tax=Lysobacter enzymogenes TaxID=69 RepID=UPI003D2F6C1B
MGRPSGPTLFGQVATIRNKSIGTEVPPTTAGMGARASVGGPSGPTLFAQRATIRNKSIGTEVPLTTAGMGDRAFVGGPSGPTLFGQIASQSGTRASRLKSLPRKRAAFAALFPVAGRDGLTSSARRPCADPRPCRSSPTRRRWRSASCRRRRRS